MAGRPAGGTVSVMTQHAQTAACGTVKTNDPLTEITRMISAEDGPRLVVVTGPSGCGRTTLLRTLEAALRGRGTNTYLIRVSMRSSANTLHTALRVISREDHPEDRQPLPPASVPLPEQAAGAVAAAFAAGGTITLLIDDAQWLDLYSLVMLETLIRRIGTAKVRFVCAARTPLPSSSPAPIRASVAGLIEDGLARILTLRPLSGARISAICGAAFGAQPDFELLTHLRRLSAGRPAALFPLIEQYVRSGTTMVVTGHVHLKADAPGRVSLPDHHPLLIDIRRLGAVAWRVAKAMAALQPLGHAATRLVSEVLGVPEQEIRDTLAHMHQAGILARSKHGWRFRVPLLTPVLTARLGPFERQHLARRAVTAVWDDGVPCPDQAFLADQVALAGRWIDRSRARETLLSHSLSVVPGEGGYRDRWLSTAEGLSGAEPAPVQVLCSRATASVFHGGYRQALQSVETARRELAAELGNDDIAELDRAELLALHALGNPTEVENIAGDVTSRGITGQALALMLLHRWHDCLQLLNARRQDWTGTPLSAYFGYLTEAQAQLVLGRTQPAEQSLGDARRLLAVLREHHRYELSGLDAVAEFLGEPDRTIHTSADTLPAAAAALVASRQGHFRDSVALTRKAIASGTVHGQEITHTLMYRTAAIAQLACGHLSNSRALLAEARQVHAPLGYLLDGVEAQLDLVLGNPDGARERLVRALGRAAAAGELLGTDTLWRQLAEIDIDRNEPGNARACLVEIEQVQAVAVSAPAMLNHALVTALLDGNRHEAAKAVDLARQVCDPWDLACIASRLVTRGLCDPAALPGVYTSLGAADAVLSRAWLRNVMTEQGVPIPGRQQTLAENDQLLATLVADGLTNREVAAVLWTTEKSVEGRLARLFSRTGYQSRVELALAVLTGAPQQAHATARSRRPGGISRRMTQPAP
jgi:energy-coupling factor transporter ATP-binding protein EcfA2